MPHNLYNKQFFDAHSENALSSARVVAPIVTALIETRSVVDVGCGRGAWLQAFIENGATTVRGFDGAYVDKAKLYFDPLCFTPVDLRREFTIDGRYDLAICLEVVEHLPRKRADALIRKLTSVADVVLFSAAIPGQPGAGHINARWPSHWIDLFGRRGFKAADAIRPQIRERVSVDWWYRQNIMLFCNGTALEAYPKLGSYLPNRCAMEWVHIAAAMPHLGFRNKLRRLPSELWLAITERTARAR